MGDTGFKPVKGATAAGGDFDRVVAFPLVLSSSGFLPSFQKSLFLGLVAVSSTVDSTIAARGTAVGGSFNKGAAESFDSVLGALILSVTEGSLDDMLAIGIAHGAGVDGLICLSQRSQSGYRVRGRRKE